MPKTIKNIETDEILAKTLIRIGFFQHSKGVFEQIIDRSTDATDFV